MSHPNDQVLQAEHAAALAEATDAPQTEGVQKNHLNAIPQLARAHIALREGTQSVIFDGDTSTELLILLYQSELRVAKALGQAAADAEEYYLDRINQLREELSLAQAATTAEAADQGHELRDTEQPPAASEQAPNQGAHAG